MARKRSVAARPWVLAGIAPDGFLVRRVEAAAARDGMAVDAWVERWLATVLRHHYGPVRDEGDRSQTPQTLIGQSVAARADIQRNLTAMSEQLSRLSRAVGIAHAQVEGVEREVHGLEKDVSVTSEAIQRLPVNLRGRGQ
ncbi:hypothetical protein [Arenibaculum pallidiluteum]|uniref:hypothetical protein n=1 Tax=Arenibaculum pallidiluteum TaxID=2812559 RepID=UPI001A9767E6|nr:hypothetical protein [Arenibaculum pallidiluteum]